MPLSFLQRLPTNIFTPDSVLEYCHQSNKRSDEFECTLCGNTHYFSTLYNIGLLGYIYESKSETGFKNSIKQIGDSIFAVSQQTLPEAMLYYAHPGLGNIIKGEREKAQLRYIPSYFIVNSSEIFVKSSEVLTLKHFCAALVGNSKENQVFLTSTGRDLSDLRKRVKINLEDAGYRVFGYEFDTFPQMDFNGVPFVEHNHGETHDHCIDTVLSCKHLIYIFEGRFGGKYQGKDYQQYIDAHKDIIKFKPSVSFTEYLIAKEYGKNVKVYVSAGVDIARGEWQKNGSPEVYESHYADNTKVFRQLGYFNSLGNGTWLDMYADTLDLEKFISSHFPRLKANICAEDQPFLTSPEK